MANVNEFKLDPDLIPVLQGHISFAAQDATDRVDRIMKSYSSTVGTSAWTSVAATAALAIQTEKSRPLWNELMRVLDDLREGINKAAGLQMDQIEQGRTQVQQAAAGQQSALATNFKRL